MYQVLHNCFRQKLIVTTITNKDSKAKSYLIKDPNTEESFEFGEEEYFLCKSMDGNTTPSEIIDNFKNRFGLSLSEEDFQQFAQQIADFGLLESSTGKDSSPLPVSFGDTQESSSKTIADVTITEEETLEPSPPKRTKRKKKGKTYLWTLPNSGPKFALLASILKPISGVIKLLFWTLIAGLPLALFTFFNNQEEFWQAMASSVKPLPYLTAYIFNICFANLTAKLAQGIMLAYYGGTVEKFGLIFTVRFLPRFYVDRKAMWQLERKAQLWTFGIPLLVRLILFVLGVLTWFWSRGAGNQFGTWALLLAHATFVDFLLDGFPLWPVDGYMLFVSYFRLPRDFINRAYLVLEMVINRRPLPKSLSLKEKWVLLVYGPAALLFWFSMMFLFGRGTAAGLSESFPGIFGRATTALLTGALLVVTLRRPIGFLLARIGHKSTSERSPAVERAVLHRELISRKKTGKSWIKQGVKILLLVGFCGLLFLPYRYRPGGPVQLLPPIQQQIQAQVEGKITKVMFKGGDGQWIKAGTVIANMEAVDIENAVLITQEQVRQQQAELEKQQANLNKLLATPKKEDVEVAKQQVEVAKGGLQTAIGKAEFSARRADRFKELYNTGAVSLQQYENSQKEAEIDRNTVEEKKLNVEEVKQNVKTKQQNLQTAQANLALVMSGPYPQDIEAARKEVEAARANLRRLQQQFKFNQDQIKRTPLLMPIDGYLVTPDLDQKVGGYLKQGEVFAVAEDNRNIRGEVRIPEYNAGEFSVGRTVVIKLLAYPDKPIIGKVISIEPTASNSATGSPVPSERAENSKERFIRVIIDIPNTEKILKAGMSGYAKIEGRTMPFIVAFARPIIRFVQIEVWSWIP